MHLNKCFMYSGTPEKIVPSVTKVENDLKGYMHMLVISAKGNLFTKSIPEKTQPCNDI